MLQTINEINYTRGLRRLGLRGFKRLEKFRSKTLRREYGQKL